MHLFGHNLDHDYCSNSLVKGSGTPYQFLGVLVHTMAMSGLSRVRTELFQLLVIPLRHIQYRRTASLRAMATLAIFRPRRSAKWKNLLRHSWSLRTVTWAASTSKKRNRELPRFVMCPSRRRSPLDSSMGTSPR